MLRGTDILPRNIPQYFSALGLNFPHMMWNTVSPTEHGYGYE